MDGTTLGGHFQSTALVKNTHFGHPEPRSLGPWLAFWACCRAEGPLCYSESESPLVDRRGHRIPLRVP